MQNPFDPVPENAMQVAGGDLVEAFGFAFDEKMPASAKLVLQRAQDTVADMRGKISQSLASQWADHAVNLHDLQGKIAYDLAQTATRAGETLQALQQPIITQAVGELGNAIERVMPLGVNLPSPDVEYTPPACVRIREAAASGDIGPALECYRAVAWPQRFVRGADYDAAVKFVLQSLPNDPAMQDAVAERIFELQNLPPEVQQPPIVLPGEPPVSVAPSTGVTPSPFRPGVIEGGSPGTVPGGAGGPGVSLPAQIPASCLAAVERWAARVIAAAKQCYAQHANNPDRLEHCLEQVAAMAAATAPNCGTGFPTWTPGGGIGWSPGGIGGGIGGEFPGGGFPGLPGPLPGGIPGGFPPGPPEAGFPPFVPGGPFYPAPGSPAVPVYPGTPAGGSGPTCDPAFILEFFTSEAQSGNDIDTACADFTASTGVPCYPSYSPQCDSGYTLFTVPANAPPGLYGVCVKCSVSQPTPISPGGPCPPPTIVVNCGTTCPPTQPAQPSTPQSPTPPVRQPPVNLAVHQQPVDGCSEFGEVPVASLSEGVSTFAQWLGIQNADGSVRVPFPDAGISDPGKLIANAILGIINQPVNQLLTGLSAIVNQSPCASGQQLGLIFTEALLRFAQQYLAIPLEQITTPMDQQRHFSCPVDLPSIAEAAGAWLGNTIDEKTLECWVRAANGRYPEFKKYIDATRSKLQALQLGMLLMRGKIDRPTYETRIRELGYTQDHDAQDVLDLLQQIPPATDLVRFMVRDAEDTVNVNWTESDRIFKDKWKGQLEKWTRQQGIDENYMLYVWRSHWQLPSPGQLFDMLHRLSRLPGDDPRSVSADLIRSTLLQQDIHPDWVDRFMAISYTPIGRIDARRAFEVGALDIDGLKRAYLDLGYNEENATTLAKYNSLQTQLKFTRLPVIKEYAKGEVNDVELDAILRAQGADSDTVTLCLTKARMEAEKLRRRRCLTAYRLRYLHGENTSAETAVAIQSLGLSASQSDAILAGWTCERQARGKAIPAGELCQLYEIGAITAPELVERLQRLEYSYEDAVLLARKCVQRVNDKLTKQEQQQIKEQERIAKQQQTALQREAATVARKVRQGQQLAARSQRIQLAREKRLIEAGNSFQKHSGLSLPDAIINVKAMYQAYLGRSMWLPDEIIQALQVATQNKTVADLPALQTAVDAALAS